MSLKEFQIISKLGQGSYSVVYKALRLEDHTIYALKRVKMGVMNLRDRENALNEIRILASIRHANVVCYKQAFVDQPSQSLFIVMEFANDGDAAAKIAKHLKTNQLISENQVWSIFIQMVIGLKQLHDRNILHRDIKPANVFLHEKDMVKLGDMNVSKIAEAGMCLTQTGTPFYASPQVWKDLPYDQKSDIWSLGCVLYEIVSLKPPFRAEDTEGLMKKVTRGIYPRIPSQYSQELSAMIRSLLQLNPDLRPSCDRILNFPIIQRKTNPIILEELEYAQMLRTIKAESDFASIGGQLPKANYKPLAVKKFKGIKSLIDSLESPSMCEVESLPFLERDRKIKAINKTSDNTDRLLQKHTNSINARDRKSSQIVHSHAGIQVNGINLKLDKEVKELKLPKVDRRYTKVKENKIKQGSVRVHKIYES